MTNAALDALLDRIEHDDGVLGAFLTGSLARDGMVTPDSDADVIVVVTPEARARWSGWRSADLDVAVFVPADLESPPLPRSDLDGWWNRYAFTHARVLTDRAGIQQLVEAQASLTPAEALEVGAEYLDGYLNFAIRSLKSARDARPLESRLDAAESIPYALVTIFALHGRIRPYNKYLAWELARFPLPGFDGLIELAAEIVATGMPAPQRRLFAQVDRTAVHPELRAVMDSWGDDLAILRSE